MHNDSRIMLLAWPWNGPADLPDIVGRELAARGFDPADAPADAVVTDAVTVLHGSEQTGAILAIADSTPDGARSLGELVTELTDGGLTVHLYADVSLRVEAHCALHIPRPRGGRPAVRRDRVSAGEIVVGASDLVGSAGSLGELTDAELAGRVRELLAHPDALPGAVRTFTAVGADSSAPPVAAAHIDHAHLNTAARILHDTAHRAGYSAGEQDGSRWAAARHADTALFVVGALMDLATRSTDDAAQRALMSVARRTLGQTPQLAADDTRTAIRLLKGALAPRGEMADAASLRDVADAALRGRTVLREIAPGIGPLTP